MFNIDNQKFEETREKAELFYRKIGEIYCPYFKDKIAFNSRGIEHIKFHNIRKARTRQDQYIRFRLISLAPKIIGDSHTLQGISTRNVFEHEKSHKKWQTVLRQATYYEFVAVIKDVRVRVIIKKV